MKYIVQPGDTLSLIANRVYGDPLRWADLWHANPWIDPNVLYPGSTLDLPDIPTPEIPEIIAGLQLIEADLR